MATGKGILKVCVSLPPWLLVAALLFGVGLLPTADAAELLIDQGVVVKFGPDARLVVRDELRTSPGVVFTGLGDDTVGGSTAEVAPAATMGSWVGVEVDPVTGVGDLSVSGLEIRYAGGQDAAGLSLSQHNYVIDRLIVRDSVRGLRITDGGTVRLTNVNLIDNVVGLEVDRGATPTISGSDISGNLEFGVLNFTPATTVRARSNWWGDPQGPRLEDDGSGSGDRVSVGVDYGNFQTVAPLLNCTATPADGSYVVREPTIVLALACPAASTVRVAFSSNFGGIPARAFETRLEVALPAEPGERTLHVQFNSATGRSVVYRLPEPVRFEPAAPVVRVVAPAAGATIRGDTLIRANASSAAGIDRVAFFAGDVLIGVVENAPYEQIWQVGGFDDGTHILRAEATDAYGLEASHTVTVRLNKAPVDTNPPTIADIAFDGVPAAEGMMVNAPGTLSFRVEDDSALGRVQVILGGSAVPSGRSGNVYSAFLSFDNVGNGYQSISIRAQDVHGNAAEHSFGINVDLPGPGVPRIIGPASDAVVDRAQVQVNGQATPGSWVQLYLDDAPVGGLLPIVAGGSFASVVTLPGEGQYVLRADARNSRGTSARSGPHPITYVAPLPSVAIGAPADGALIVADTEIIAVASDASGIARVEILVDGSMLGSVQAPPYVVTWPIEGVAEGEHELTAIAYNILGKSKSASRTVRVEHPTAIETVPTPYTGHVTSVAPAISYGEQPITIRGSAISRLDAAAVPNALLALVLRVDGFERKINVTTDDSGRFEFVFRPQASDAGTYSVAARHPGEAAAAPGGTFTINRLGIRSSRVNLDAARTVPTLFEVEFSSSAGTGVRGVRLHALPQDQPGGQLPPGVQVTTGNAVDVPAGGRARVQVSVLGSSGAADSGSLILRATASDSGAESRGTVRVDFRMREPQPALRPTPGYIETGVRHEDTVSAAVQLENRGVAPAHDVAVALVGSGGSSVPPWMFLSSAPQLGSLPPGGTATIQITAAPPATVSDGIYGATLRVSSSNGTGGDIPVSIGVTQSGEGAVEFHVADIYTMTLDGDGLPIPGVAGARVRIQHETVTSIDRTATTDASGRVSFTGLPAGRYVYRASGSKHADASGRIVVRPGVSIAEDVFLDYSAVSFEWSVVETTIRDRYEVILDAVYEASVPAPVVLIEPMSINIPDLQVGEEYTGELTISNYGLVRADNVVFTPPSSDEYYRIEILGEVPSQLDAKQRITLPYRITGLAALPASQPVPDVIADVMAWVQAKATASSGTCWSYRNVIGLKHEYECANGAWRVASTTATINKVYGSHCGSPGSAPIWIGGGGGGGGWGGGWGGAAPAMPLAPGCSPECDGPCCKDSGASPGGGQ